MSGAVLSGATTFAAGATEAIGVGYTVSNFTVSGGLTLELDRNGSATGATTVQSGGTLLLVGGITGTSEFGFATSAGGTLQLDDSQHFGGTISGFDVPGDIDLRDIAFGSGTTLGYAGDVSSGTLTVSDGTHTATLNLLGQYTVGNFTLHSDGNGGTLVTDPPLAGLAGNPYLTPPHS